MKRLAPFVLFVFFVLSSPAGTFQCQWLFRDAGSNVLALKQVEYQPIASYGTDGGTVIITGDKKIKQATAAGSLTVDLFNGRSYRVKCIGSNFETVFTNSFDTNVTGLVNGADPAYLTAPIRDTSTIAYSQAAADARFLNRTNGSGRALTLAGTNTLTAISLGGEVRTNWPTAGSSQTNWSLVAITNAGDMAWSNAATFVPSVLAVATNRVNEASNALFLQIPATNNFIAQAQADAAATNAQNAAKAYVAILGPARLTGTNTFTGPTNTFTGEIRGPGDFRVLAENEAGDVRGGLFIGTSFQGAHVGNGSQVTDINAGNIASGTISSERLPAGVLTNGSVINAASATNNPAGYEIAGNQRSVGVLTVGDSIGNPLGVTISNRFPAHSYANALCILSGGSLHMVKNAAVPGALTEDVQSTLSGNISTHLVGVGNYVLNNAAINNWPSSNVVTTASNQCNNIQACLDRGQIPVVIGCTPAGSNNIALITKYNDLMAYNCGRLGAVWVNAFDALVERDQTSSFYGYLKREYQHDPAGAMIHPNQRAAFLVARLVAEKIGLPPKMYDNNALLAFDFGSTNNLISNGLFGGASTATNWTTDGVGGVGLMADANLPAGANWVSITNSTLSGFTSISNYVATGFTAGDLVSFCARIELWMTNAASDGGAIVQCVFNGASVTNGSVLRPIEYVTNSIARGAVFNFRGNIAAGTTSIAVLAQLTNCQAVLRIAQMKLCNLAVNGSLGGYAHTPTYRGFLTPAGNGVKIGVGGNLDGNVGIKKDPHTSYDLLVGRALANTNYVSGVGTWDVFNPGGSAARNVMNLIGNQRFEVVHGGITNISMRTNVVQVMDLVRGAVSISEGGATSSVAFHFGAGVNFNFQTNADAVTPNSTIYMTNAGRVFRSSAWEQVP